MFNDLFKLLLSICTSFNFFSKGVPCKLEGEVFSWILSAPFSICVKPVSTTSVAPVTIVLVPLAAVPTSVALKKATVLLIMKNNGLNISAASFVPCAKYMKILIPNKAKMKTIASHV